MTKNIDKRINDLNKRISSDDVKVLILEVNNDYSLDIKINDKMEHFNNYKDYLDAYIYPNKKRSIAIIVDDINLCN